MLHARALDELDRSCPQAKDDLDAAWGAWHRAHIARAAGLSEGGER